MRPQPDVWSVNAYVAHLPDAARIISERVQAIAAQENPWLPDQVVCRPELSSLSTFLPLIAKIAPPPSMATDAPASA